MSTMSAGVNIFLILSLITLLPKFILCQSNSNSLEFPNLSHRIIDSEDSYDIFVTINITPHQVHDNKFYVKTKIELDASAILYNLIGDIISDSDLKYQWSTKYGTLLTDPRGGSSIKLKYLTAQDDDLVKVDVYYKNYTSPIIASKTITLNSRDPVFVLEPSGKFFLEHGELLNVKLSFNGSAPFQYCHKFCLDQDYIPCLDFCYPYHYTDEHQISISHYLHYVGNYTLFFDVHNVVSREIKHYRIKINDTVREQTLPFAPIVSSILAVLILLTGVALHLHFRTKTYTETANFDFIRQDQDEEEWEDGPYSLIQRVRNLLFNEDYEATNERRHLFFSEPRDRNNKSVIYT